MSERLPRVWNEEYVNQRPSSDFICNDVVEIGKDEWMFFDVYQRYSPELLRTRPRRILFSLTICSARNRTSAGYYREDPFEYWKEIFNAIPSRAFFQVIIELDVTSSAARKLAVPDINPDWNLFVLTFKADGLVRVEINYELYYSVSLHSQKDFAYGANPILGELLIFTSNAQKIYAYSLEPKSSCLMIFPETSRVPQKLVEFEHQFEEETGDYAEVFHQIVSANSEVLYDDNTSFRCKNVSSLICVIRDLSSAQQTKLLNVWMNLTRQMKGPLWLSRAEEEIVYFNSSIDRIEFKTNVSSGADRRWRGVHMKLIEILLVIVRLELPVYVMLWIVDFLPNVKTIKEVLKVRLIEGVRRSVAKIDAARALRVVAAK